MAADLHCHTTCSDGTDTVEELVFMAKARGLSAVAVTDHDTFAGVRCAIQAGKQNGIRVVPGIEISTRDAKTGRKAHILCYGCPHPEQLELLCRRTVESRQQAALQMIQRVAQMYPISLEMVQRRAQGSQSLFKQHILHALMDAGYAHEIFGELFEKLFDSRRGLAYLPVTYPETREVLHAIRAAGGVAVLAHPGEYNSYALLEELAAAHQIQGVEVSHPRNKPGDEERFRAVAARYGLLITGGTDFHGAYTKVPHPLGTCTATDEELAALLQAAGE